MGQELYEKVNYISGLKFLFSNYIREYDLSKANINVLFLKGFLDKDIYDKLYNATREERQITIGLMESRDRKVTLAKAEGIKEAKRMLFEANNIQDNEVLTIKNDAVFIINKVLHHTKFGDYIDFKLKNVFTDFIYLKGIEIYYGYDRIRQIENIQTKGLGKNAYLHKDYMLDFIVYIISELENGNTEDAISSFSDFFNDYISCNLDIGYYREFNSDSMYSIINSKYKVPVADNDVYTKTKVININYNMNLLRDLFGYISGKYFTDKRF